MPYRFKLALFVLCVWGLEACSHVDESVYTLEKPVVETRSSSFLSSSSNVLSSSSLKSSSSSALSSSNTLSSSVAISSSSL